MEHLGVAPDVVAFGKKAQVCGIYASTRVDEVPDNVFALPSRINSTWGGNLADMVRCRRFIEIIEEDGLAAHIAAMGDRLVAGLRGIARRTGAFTSPRGRGSLAAVTLASPEARGKLLDAMFSRELAALPSGPTSVRFRLPLVIQRGGDRRDPEPGRSLRGKGLTGWPSGLPPPTITGPGTAVGEGATDPAPPCLG